MMRKGTSCLIMIYIMVTAAAMNTDSHAHIPDPPFQDQSAPVLAPQTDGREGWVATDSATPRLTWAPRISLPQVVTWHLDLRRTDVENVSYNWAIPVTDGPWKTLDAVDFPSRSRFAWSVTPEFRDGRKGILESAAFEVGLKEESDWQAQWIGMTKALRGEAAPLFRKSFIIDRMPVSARLYVVGLGWHEAYINGKRLGEGVLDPAQTDYERRVFYLAHDVTLELQQGENAIGVWVGDGWFNQDRVWGKQGLSYGEPRMIAQLEIQFEDGTTEVISSDEDWKTATSAITSNNVYHGESFDARMHDPAWSTPGFDDEKWASAELSASPGGNLVCQELQSCRRLRKREVASWTEPSPGVFLADFGQNITGWAKVRLSATPGTRLKLRFAESIFEDGNIDPNSTGVVHTKAVQTDEYIFKGEGIEEWEPRFTYHVFQYVEVTFSEGQLLSSLSEEGALQGISVYTDMPVRGEFSCSDETMQRMFEMADWTTVGNIQGLPTDCPGRERCGWTGDAHLLTPFALHAYDSAAMWTKYQGDIVTSAEFEGEMISFGNTFHDRHRAFKAAGLPTMIAPGKRRSGAASPDWGSAIIFIPWDVYLYTGDKRILEDNYSSCVQWVAHLSSLADEDGIIRKGLGDWCTPYRRGEPRPENKIEYFGRIVPELSTACYWRSADILARVARLLNKPDDATRFRELAKRTRTAFLTEFHDPTTGGFADQTINAIALDWGLLPPEWRQQASDYLAQQIEDSEFHFYTGVFGLTSLFPALGDFGNGNTIKGIFDNETAPGFRYQLSLGATTAWEIYADESDIGTSYERSKSHPFQIAWASWFFEGLAGIQIDESIPGFKRFALAPQMTTELEWVNCREHTAMGVVESSWERAEETLNWTIEVPVGAQAEITAPGKVLNFTPLENALTRNFQTTLNAGRYRLKIAL